MLAVIHTMLQPLQWKQARGAWAPLCLGAALLLPGANVVSAPALNVRVEAEESVYQFTPANNGAGPLWCSGSTCLARVGDRVFASGLETIPDAKPLNNCRWTLYERQKTGWQRIETDPSGRTREPCPIAVWGNATLLLSANPTIAEPGAYAGPARPEILRFTSFEPPAWERLLPAWEGQPAFTEHSYRSFAADGPNRELILLQNVGYTHCEWAFCNREGKWTAGRLAWPEGKEYPKPQPIRVCYPNVALKNGAVHFVGVSDIVEPYPEWREFKKQLTGQEWDYDFRRLFYTFATDITKKKFHPWVELASRDKTCGWISPGDLWVAADGTAHVVWTERAVDERLRKRFFPDARQSISIGYALIRNGKPLLRKILVASEEGTKSEGTPGAPRFHVTPDGRLFVCYYLQGRNESGKTVNENRLAEMSPDGTISKTVSLPLSHPFSSYFTATPRAGSEPSRFLELLGLRAGDSSTISYAKLKLW